MKRAVLTFVGVLTAASACSVPARALDTLMRPVPGEVVLAFGSRYGSGSGRTHSGLDLAAGAGEPVLAPCDGRVVFAGLVPADGGGRVGAVTIEPEAGVLVTVLPLESVEVRRGDAVAEGAAVGSIAAAGDDSSEAPHLHLSVRRDGRYVDPGPVLETVQPSSAVGGEPDRAADAGGAMPAADASACEQTGAWQACAHPSTVPRVRAGSAAAAPRATSPAVVQVAAPAAEEASVREALWRALAAMGSLRRAGARDLPPLPAPSAARAFQARAGGPMLAWGDQWRSSVPVAAASALAVCAAAAVRKAVRARA